MIDLAVHFDEAVVLLGVAVRRLRSCRLLVVQSTCLLILRVAFTEKEVPLDAFFGLDVIDLGDLL